MRNFKKIDFRFFKAAMFDYDGTLTKKGVYLIEKKIVEKIAELAFKGFPIGICTGRQLESFLRRFKSIQKDISRKYGVKTLENIYLLGENGAVGYYFDLKKNKYRIFYQASWPKEIPKQEFKKNLKKKMERTVEIMGHKVPIVLRPADIDAPIDEIYEASYEIYKISTKFINSYQVRDPKTGKIYKAKNYLHCGNSGLGCLICPHDADKDTAIKKFHEFLKKKRGVKFNLKDKHLREIMVVGDSPQKGGNDYYFLNGRYGTAFSVCEKCKINNLAATGRVFSKTAANFSKMPYPVLNNKGEELYNNKGTLYLLSQL